MSRMRCASYTVGPQAYHFNGFAFSTGTMFFCTRRSRSPNVGARRREHPHWAPARRRAGARAARATSSSVRWCRRRQAHRGRLSQRLRRDPWRSGCRQRSAQTAALRVDRARAHSLRDRWTSQVRSQRARLPPPLNSNFRFCLTTACSTISRCGCPRARTRSRTRSTCGTAAVRR